MRIRPAFGQRCLPDTPFAPRTSICTLQTIACRRALTAGCRMAATSHDRWPRTRRVMQHEDCNRRQPCHHRTWRRARQLAYANPPTISNGTQLSSASQPTAIQKRCGSLSTRKIRAGRPRITLT
ncbi:hypothetical protein XCV0649 [Xanthomonas euvesicatoria pv. vesicatoria str. 85-10]|uniref:Uncharacterized protein n=1 Tax=Xanthomonas euvesicatoria pv. vesicatoria (strain 85-10) TaxID=316273 RepID=Q3BXY3_XANE5|nr:hypothetical protein XCV0649 [Xanthomonas euvesicatoria pv. vesicatoria str. 85-10]